MFFKKIYKWPPTISENDSNTNNQEINHQDHNKISSHFGADIKRVKKAIHMPMVLKEKDYHLLFLQVGTNTTMAKIYIDSSKSGNRIVMHAA